MFKKQGGSETGNGSVDESSQIKEKSVDEAEKEKKKMQVNATVRSQVRKLMC